jgi:PAS domain S-box-containing protein
MGVPDPGSSSQGSSPPSSHSPLADALSGIGERFHRLLLAADIGYVTLDREGRVVEANQEFLRLVGRTRLEEIQGRSILEVTAPSDRERASDEIRRCLDTGSVSNIEIDCLRPDGARQAIELGATAVEIGSEVRVLTLCRDVTTRRRTVERAAQVNRLNEALLFPGPIQDKLKLIVGTAVDLVDGDFARIWVVRPGDLCGSGCFHAEATTGRHACLHRDRCLHLIASAGRYTHLDGPRHCRVPFGAYKIGRVASGDEVSFVTNDVTHDPRVHDPAWAGELGLVAFAGYRLLSPAGKPMGVLALFSRHAIGEKEGELLQNLASTTAQVLQTAMAEEALRLSEERLRLALEAADQGLWDLDLAKDGGYCSPRYYSLLGYEPGEFALQREIVTDMVHPDDLPAVRDGVRKCVRGDRDTWRLEYRMRRKSGLYIWVVTHGRVVSRDADGRALRMTGTLSDITEQKSMQEQLLQAQKMESVGRLAGGVAHDFNNLLTVINGYSNLLLSGLPEDDPRRESVGEIRHAGERAAALTQQLLAFSRRQTFQPKLLSLNAAVAETERMLQHVIGEEVRLVTVLGPGLGLIKADAGQISQVLMNLAVNARDAMPNGGSLTVETANEDLDESGAASHPGFRPGRFVRLSVSDTGLGMDEETRRHLFEPFYTTKPLGRGTGLGLSSVYGIVQQSGGWIWVQSKPTEGAAFHIYLPRVDAPLEASSAVPEEPRETAGHGTILLVEDQENVRRLAASVLESFGYCVLKAANGQEALALSASYAAPIHLLLTDVVMPGLSGTELAGQVASLRPGIRVLFVSGYTDSVIAQHGLLGEDQAFLQKPFTPPALAARVREVLGRLT